MENMKDFENQELEHPVENNDVVSKDAESENIKEIEPENAEENSEDEDAAYQEALKDFSSRIIVVERPEDVKDKFTKYVKRMSGVDCILGLINYEEMRIHLLPDDFEPPYDPITMWAIAVRNCVKESKLVEQPLKEGVEMYAVTSSCGRGVICCDEFWNSVCEKFKVMRLVIHMYCKSSTELYIAVVPVKNDEKLEARAFLNQANKDGQAENRTSYMFVKEVGLLTEAALNSEE